MFPYDNNSPTYNQLQDQLKSIMVSTGQHTEQHVVKVNGREGANNFYLSPNSDAILLDMNNPLIWFVQTDGAGYKTITPYDISPHKETTQNDILKSMEDRITKLEEVIRDGKSNSSAVNGKPGNKQWKQHNDAGSRGNDEG